MKNLKILVLFTIISSAFLGSCTKDNSEDVVTQKSLTLRAMLQEMKIAVSDAAKNNYKSDEIEMCFDFVYPLTLSYNTGTTVAVNSLDQILTLLETETEDMYLDGIAFPFQVISAEDGTVTIINTESDFNTLVEDCGYDTYDDSINESDCFELVYPFSVTNSQNQSIIINSEIELNNILDSLNDEDYLFPVFPFSVLQNGQIVVLNNEFELYELSDLCE